VALNRARRHTRSVITVEYGQSIIRPNHIRGKAVHRSGVQRKHVVSACRPRACAALDTRAPAHTQEFAAGGLVTVGATSQTQPTTSEVKEQACPRLCHEGVWGCRGTAPLDGDEWSDSHYGRFVPRERLLYPLNRRVNSVDVELRVHRQFCNRRL
jgi:hypothetical protein